MEEAKRSGGFLQFKNFCFSYPKYNYNTINNYLSKKKIPFENESIRVERKNIILTPKPTFATEAGTRSIVPILRKVKMKIANDIDRDWEYWLSQPVSKRAEAVTFLVLQMLEKGEKMDKTHVKKIKLQK